jgi:uncharacterized integral membrane protein
MVVAVLITLLSGNKGLQQTQQSMTEIPETTAKVKWSFILLGIVILSLYLIFNR